MSGSDLDYEFGDTDDSIGFEEVVDGQAPVVEQIELSAAIIDKAYRDVDKAIRAQYEVDISDTGLEGPDWIKYKLRLTIERDLDCAKNEVERVSALAQWFQIEAIFTSAQIK